VTTTCMLLAHDSVNCSNGGSQSISFTDAPCILYLSRSSYMVFFAYPPK
jgi:hypothetical protein